MAKLLKQTLYAEYSDRENEPLCQNRQPTHLTPYSGDSCTFSLKRAPRNKVLGRLSRPASIHIYDITQDAFVLELRNIPMSTTVERLLVESGAEVVHGQIHSTFRLHLGAANAPLVRHLGQLIRRIPTGDRVDRFSPPGSQSTQVGRALLKLARVLESTH